MSVVASVEDVAPCRKQVTIAVPKPAVDAETERVLAEYRKKAKISGFRPGKAPVGIVRQRFKGEIEQDVVDRLVPRYWRQAEAELQIDPLLPPELEKVDFGGDDGMSFVAVVEVRPEIELGSLDGFQLPELAVEPTDEEVSQQLEQIRRRVASWKEVDRPAGRGDRVLAEIQRGDEEAQRVLVEVGDERVWEELSMAVMGLGPGQQSSFERADEEGTTHTYAVKADTVEEVELPPLDDELAKKVSRFETLEELEAGIRRTIGAEKERERRRRREHALLDQLRERHPLELPQGVVHREMESMLHDYAHELAHQGVDLERTEIDWPALGEQMRPTAERAVHSRLVLDAIAEKEEVAVPEDQVEEVVRELAQARNSTPLAVRRDLDGSGRLASLRRQLRRQEVMRRLMGETEPVQSEATAEPDPES